MRGAIPLAFQKKMISLILIIYIYFSYYFYGVKGFIFFFLFFLFLFLQVLFFTTCERKILALTQRRIGPKVVGDSGRLQFLADALKLITKTYFSPKKVNSLFFQNSAIAVF